MLRLCQNFKKVLINKWRNNQQYRTRNNICLKFGQLIQARINRKLWNKKTLAGPKSTTSDGKETSPHDKAVTAHTTKALGKNTITNHNKFWVVDRSHQKVIIKIISTYFVSASALDYLQTLLMCILCLLLPNSAHVT
jgi:hypothetical protein